MAKAPDIEEEEAEEAAPRKGGRKPWVPTEAQRQTALSLFAAGASFRQVAKRLGIAKKTADKHLRKEFEEGWDDANLQLHATMLELAIRRKNTTMLIWLSKNRMGWSDRQENINPPLPPMRHELSLRVEYVHPADPRALPPPPAGTAMIEAKARPGPPLDEAAP